MDTKDKVQEYIAKKLVLHGAGIYMGRNGEKRSTKLSKKKTIIEGMRPRTNSVSVNNFKYRQLYKSMIYEMIK